MQRKQACPRTSGGRPARATTLVVALFAATLMWAGGVANVPPVSASPAFSAAAPPPLCSTTANVSPCVQQPTFFDGGYTATPILVDMPSMRLETMDAQTPYSGAVTFSITSFATAKSGLVMQPPYWANPVQLIPLDADPTAGIIFMQPDGECGGHATCTYVTTSTDLKAGWYAAGHNGIDLVGQQTCLPSLLGCAATSSQGAVYIPKGSEVKPPTVAVNATGSGLTTKAIAVATDPLGQGLSLTWSFGDGTPDVPGSLGQVISHTYAYVGDYQVVARVRSADGRNGVAAAESGILPPAPVLRSVTRVSPPSNGHAGVAAGLVQGWPAGGVATLRYWTTGCPANPGSNAALNSAIPAGGAPVASDGTIDIAFGYFDAAANAAVLDVQAYVDFGDGVVVSVHRYSNCYTAVTTAATTTGATSAGATEVPVSSSSVPIGNDAMIDAGTAAAERRLVTGHGSLIVAPLVNPHPAGAVVMDLGAPIPPYVVPGPPADPSLPGAGGGGGPSGGSGYVPLTPVRLLDTRTDPGTTTIDGQGLGAGLLAAGSTVELVVANRGGVPADASAVVLNVAVTGAASSGFVTAYPCGVAKPNAANLNYAAGDTVPNLVVAKVGAGGKVCLFTYGATHLVADVNGYFPAGASYAALTPGRLMDSRIGGVTVDGVAAATGIVTGGSVFELPVAGRGGVPSDASAVVLNVAVTGAASSGFVTVFPCGVTKPTAANLNYAAGDTVPNLVVAKVGAGGKVCLFAYGSTDLVADVNGYFPAGSSYAPLTPVRLLETRTDPGLSTIDGQGLGAGLLAAGSTVELVVAGRGGVPGTASAVVLNVAVTGATSSGFVTVFPCGVAKPTAANLNYAAGDTVPNLVIAKVGAGGKVCLFAYGSTDLVADVNGYFPAATG